ncbi:D-alanyl-D-alanine carboxypeptidase, partial [Candidatus Pacearchaeota archaeon]|nr:D-alanyl-D-alanine carboxypeptidase [Candidatus Pacearchaeota archaeon]
MLITGLGTATVSLPKKAQTFSPEQLLSVEAVPLKKPSAVKPIIEASAALLMDVDSGIVLYKKNPHLRLPMASLTKIMTAIIILENHNLNEVVTIEDNFDNFVEDEIGVRLWLKQYEKMTVENLLIGLMVPSAGDAALALAKYHSGSVEKFVEEMNERAKSLNLKNTKFTNPIGLDNIENHYSSAFDLAILTKYALKNRTFSRIVQ